MTSVRMLLACAGLTIAAALSFAVPGCSSDDAAPTNTSDASADTAAPDPCDVDAFFAAGGNGGPCFPVSNMACFGECLTGGCTCTRNPAGGDHGIWKCVSDLSCVPDGGPFDTDGGVDANVDDADVDGG
ncbi:MAG: hypothetical protein ABIP89_25325, partial [Polyangiaceae bacterium]